jgi:arsenate reductase (glutaredoxin)
MLTVYGLTKCTTCQKAISELAGMGHSVTLLDVRADGISDGVLRAALDQVGAARLVNRGSMTWRGLSEAERAGEPLALLKANPSLMKRPLIINGAKITAGWTKATKTALTA